MSEHINHGDRAHALLSASSAHRWLACPPSAVAAELYPEQDTEFTREGTLAHEVAEAVASRNKTALEALLQAGEATAEMVDCAEAYYEYISGLVSHESAVVLLEQRVDFSPWVPDGFGTCDCIVIQDDTLTVVDYKYGQGVAVSAVGNPQLKLYALGALNDYGFAYAVKKVEMHIFQPRINSISSDTITVTDLVDWGRYVVEPTTQLAAKGEGEYKPGEHCRFCPHAGRCRELTRVCTEYVETHSLRVAVPVLAPHEVAEVIRMEPLVSLWLRRVKEQAMTALLSGGEVPGYKVVEGRGSRSWTNPIKVSSVLIDAGYSLEDISRTELLSPAAMEKALGKKKATELLSEYIEKKPGAPTIAAATDKRPTYDRLAEAKSDFGEVDE